MEHFLSEIEKGSILQEIIKCHIDDKIPEYTEEKGFVVLRSAIFASKSIQH